MSPPLRSVVSASADVSCCPAVRILGPQHARSKEEARAQHERRGGADQDPGQLPFSWFRLGVDFDGGRLGGRAAAGSGAGGRRGRSGLRLGLRLGRGAAARVGGRRARSRAARPPGRVCAAAHRASGAEPREQPRGGWRSEQFARGRPVAGGGRGRRVRRSAVRPRRRRTSRGAWISCCWLERNANSRQLGSACDLAVLAEEIPAMLALVAFGRMSSAIWCASRKRESRMARSSASSAMPLRVWLR